MTRFEDYKDRYQSIRLDRQDGILTVTLHTDGDSLRWSRTAYSECTEAFRAIGDDRRHLLIVHLNAQADSINRPIRIHHSTC